MFPETLIYVLFIPIAIVGLWLSSQIFQLERRNISTAAMVTLAGLFIGGFLTAILGFIPLVGWFLWFLAPILNTILNIALIRHFYSVGAGKAIAVWFVGLILTVLMGMVLAVIIFAL